MLLRAAWCGDVRLRVAQFLANLWQGSCVVVDGTNTGAIVPAALAAGVMAIFVYGTLMPGRLRWPLVEPHVGGRRGATISGSLLDSGPVEPVVQP